MLFAIVYKNIIYNAQNLYDFLVDFDDKQCYTVQEIKKRRCIDMYTIDPSMSFAQVVQFYKDYVKRTKSCGRKPVSFLRFITGRY